MILILELCNWQLKKTAVLCKTNEAGPSVICLHRGTIYRLHGERESRGWGGEGGRNEFRQEGLMNIMVIGSRKQF